MITLVSGEIGREGSWKIEHADFLNIFHKILENIKINHVKTLPTQEIAYNAAL